jgi:hypothetical protein
MKRLVNNINVYERLRKILGPYLFLTILSASKKFQPTFRPNCTEPVAAPRSANPR